MLRAALACLLLLAVAAPVGAAPDRKVDPMTWFVHQCLIDDASLAAYQSLIQDRLAEADRLLQGSQGPADANGCCTSLDPVSVSSFGTCVAGVDTDGLNVIENATERDALIGSSATDGSYLVEAVHYCNSFSTSIKGCGNTSGENLMVGREADDTLFLPAVMAHERGHNTGLSHISGNSCNLMAASSGGGCLSTSECTSFRGGTPSTTPITDGSCACLDDVLGNPPAANGSFCGPPNTDRCGGGLCADLSEGVLTTLVIASDTGAPSDDAIEQNLVSGDWNALGSFGVGVVLTGLAYDDSTDTLYGVQPQTGADDLVVVDTTTGAVTSTVGAIDVTGVSEEFIISLAFNPDTGMLLAIHVDDEIFGGSATCDDFASLDPPCMSSLLEIDPSTAATTELGELNQFIFEGGLPGLAYDDARNELYGAAFVSGSLRKIDLTSCNGSTDLSCSTSAVTGVDAKVNPALSYDAYTDRLVLHGVGSTGSLEMDVIIPALGSALTTVRHRRVDGLTPAGAAVVPEPGMAIQLLSGIAMLAALSRRRLPKSPARSPGS
jgi:hypothetical protein